MVGEPCTGDDLDDQDEEGEEMLSVPLGAGREKPVIPTGRGILHGRRQESVDDGDEEDDEEEGDWALNRKALKNRGMACGDCIASSNAGTAIQTTQAVQSYAKPVLEETSDQADMHVRSRIHREGCTGKDSDSVESGDEEEKLVGNSSNMKDYAYLDGVLSNPDVHYKQDEGLKELPPPPPSLPLHPCCPPSLPPSRSARKVQLEVETATARQRYEETKHAFDERLEKLRFERLKRRLNQRLEAWVKTRRVRAELRQAVPIIDSTYGEATTQMKGKQKLYNSPQLPL